MHLLFDCVEGKNLKDNIPHKYRALIKLLGKDTPTYHDLQQFRDMVHDMIHITGYSPSQIQKLFGIEYSDFGMFIKRCLGIKLKHIRDANIASAVRMGRKTSSEKQRYMKSCNFLFDPYSYPNVPGYELLLGYGVYHHKHNPTGVCRDHMVSKEYGWRNNIPSDVISSVYNCEFLLHRDNVKKSTACSITTNMLYERISRASFDPIVKTVCLLPKTAEHKAKISKTLSNYMCVTDGTRNIKILKTGPIPQGFRRGMTRKSKMVGVVGLEPTG